MEKKVRGIVITGAIAIAGVWSCASASQGRELLFSGPIQKVDHGTDTITVLGQSFHAQTMQLSVGQIVRVYGILQKDGSVTDEVVQGTEAFGANGDPVFIKGVVTNADAAVGHVQVDGLVVDYTSQLANSQFIAPAIGDVITVAGLQPTSQGVLVASATGDFAYSIEASGPTGMAFPGATLQKSLAGGVATANMQGGGVGAANMQGGGVGAANMQGGGGARTANMQGGGVGK